MSTQSSLLLFLALFMLPCSSFSQTAEAIRWETQSATIFNELYRLPGDLPEIIIETNTRQLIKGKFKEEYQDATIRYTTADGAEISQKMKLRARGNRRKEVCNFPPVKIKFKKSDLTQQGILTFNKIKLVNQCQASDGVSGFLLKEYLAYRLYNVLTPNSFRVRLVKLTYIDSAGKDNPNEMFCILLEPENELSARLQATSVELNPTYFVHLENDQSDQLALFQYMIGNTDWNVKDLHNLITVKCPDTRKLTPIPYDFDYSGLVHAPYALPNEVLPIQDVQDRFHKGQEMTEEELIQGIAKFQALRPDLIAACEQIGTYDESAGKDALNYISGFLDLLDNPKALKRVFVKGKQ